MHAQARNVKVLVTTAVVAALLVLGVGGGIAYATDEAEDRASGLDLEKAKGAALEHTGGGRVTGTEVGDEEGYYEIEITRDDGSQLDVHLDRDLDVLGTPVDHENLDDGDWANDE
jgi:uncharacterized membrane protein YkoI